MQRTHELLKEIKSAEKHLLVHYYNYQNAWMTYNFFECLTTINNEKEFKIERLLLFIDNAASHYNCKLSKYDSNILSSNFDMRDPTH